jgi:LysM repeat protein
MIVDQLFTPKLIREGEVYDLGREYGAPAPGKKPLPRGGSIPRRHDDEPDFMDPDQRRLRADQERVKKAQDEYHAKKGVAESNTNISRLQQRIDNAYSRIYNRGDNGLEYMMGHDQYISGLMDRYLDDTLFAASNPKHLKLLANSLETIANDMEEDLVEGGVAEGTEDMPFGSVTQPDQTQTYVAPSRQDIWDKAELTNRQAEVRDYKQTLLRYARKNGRQAAEQAWAEKTDVKMTIEEILEFLDATIADPGLTPEEFLGTQGLEENAGQDSKSWMDSIRQQHPDVRFVQAKMPGAPIIALVNGKPVAQFDTKKGVAEGRLNKQRRLNEAMLMEDPIYRNFKRVGRYIAERKMSEKEILQVFADAEAGMTDKATGANRTFLGRGKDTAMDFAGGVSNALNSVWSGIQNSVPVSAVDVAYDQATDALAGLTGGQKGAVMQAIKKYRNLAKQYPKTAGLAKGALVAITGLATGGASLPAVAALVYGLDSAIKGEKASDIALKAGGAAATAWAGQKIASALGGQPTGTDAGGLDPSQFPAFDDEGNLMPGFHINPETGSAYYNPNIPNEVSALSVPTDAGLAGTPMGGGTYTIQNGDQLGYIAQANGVSVEDIRGLNPQIDFSKPLRPGMEIQLPVAGTPGQGSVWQGYQGGMYGDKVAGATSNAGQGLPSHASAAGDYGTGGGAPIDYTSPGPESIDSLGNKLEYGIPVNAKGSFVPPNPNLPPQELAAQQAAYDAWKSDFMRRFPNASPGPDGSMLSFKPGLAPMQILQKPTLPAGVQESVKFKIIPADRLIDQKTTVLAWALNESVGRKGNSISLTTLGTYTVFENVRRVAKAVNVMELKGVPGSSRPAYYRPDMPGGPGKASKPGIIGRGLNWLDKAAGKVGGALSNFGHQFTTGVTKEKLKMNWHQAGKPSDSDQLAAWLVKQGVPQEVVTSVYGKMGIPYTAPAVQAAPQPAGQTPAATDTTTGGAQRSAYAGTNPATGKAWTGDELRNKFFPAQPAAAAPAGADSTASSTAAPSGPTPTPSGTKTAAGIFPGEDPQGPNYVGRREVARRQAARAAAAAAKPAAPNFAQQNAGYAKVNMPTTMTYSGIPALKPGAASATAPAAKKVPTQAEKDAYVKSIGAPALPESRLAAVLRKPVEEMLHMVETKEDVQRIKQFVDETFVRYGAMNESAFAERDQILKHVAQIGAQKRREHSQRMAT